MAHHTINDCLEVFAEKQRTPCDLPEKPGHHYCYVSDQPDTIPLVLLLAVTIFMHSTKTLAFTVYALTITLLPVVLL